MCLRFVAALIYAVACGWLLAVTPAEERFSVHNLRLVLLLHHVLASAGLDEFCLMNQCFSQQPYFVKKLLGSGPCTPLVGGLPRWAASCAYAAYLCTAVAMLATRTAGTRSIAAVVGLSSSSPSRISPSSSL